MFDVKTMETSFDLNRAFALETFLKLNQEQERYQLYPQFFTVFKHVFLNIDFYVSVRLFQPANHPS